MLEIRSESVLAHPRDRVYRAYRDQLPQIATWIPDIERITVLRRTETAGGVDLHNEWVANREIPPYARPFVRPEHLRWDDYADWVDQEHAVHWRIGTRVFTEAVTCRGTNRFHEDPRGTRVELTGDLRIDLHRVPGFPGFLVDRVAPEVERFVVSLITPNLVQVNTSIGRFLDAGGSG